MAVVQRAQGIESLERQNALLVGTAPGQQTAKLEAFKSKIRGLTNDELGVLRYLNDHGEMQKREFATTGLNMDAVGTCFGACQSSHLIRSRIDLSTGSTFWCINAEWKTILTAFLGSEQFS